MILYLLYSTIGLGLSFLIYQVLLKKEKTFVFNRFYLLISVIICLVSPILQIETSFESSPTSGLNAVNVITEKKAVEEIIENVTIETLRKEPGLNWVPQFLWIAYLTISILFIARFFRNLHHISKQLKKNSAHLEGLQVIIIRKRNHSL